jgi:hypothetical protein
VEKSGYLNAYGGMAGIPGGLIVLDVPFFFWGARTRSATWQWVPVRKFVHWDADCEVGE